MFVLVEEELKVQNSTYLSHQTYAYINKHGHAPRGHNQYTDNYYLLLICYAMNLWLQPCEVELILRLE